MLIPGDEECIRERRKLSFVGSVVVSIAITKAGELAADPQVVLTGIPKLDADGESFEHIAEKAAIGAMISIPRPRRKSPDLVRRSGAQIGARGDQRGLGQEAHMQCAGVRSLIATLEGKLSGRKGRELH